MTETHKYGHKRNKDVLSKPPGGQYEVLLGVKGGKPRK